jgi:hypothetical protein
MTDEISDGSDVVVEFFGESHGIADESRAPLLRGTVDAFGYRGRTLEKMCLKRAL